VPASQQQLSSLLIVKDISQAWNTCVSSFHFSSSSLSLVHLVPDTNEGEHQDKPNRCEKNVWIVRQTWLLSNSSFMIPPTSLGRRMFLPLLTVVSVNTASRERSKSLATQKHIDSQLNETTVVHELRKFLISLETASAHHTGSLKLDPQDFRFMIRIIIFTTR
jgi:hypothetical protein